MAATGREPAIAWSDVRTALRIVFVYPFFAAIVLLVGWAIFGLLGDLGQSGAAWRAEQWGWERSYPDDMGDAYLDTQAEGY